MPDQLAYAVLALTVAVLGLLLPFAFHRLQLLWLSRGSRPKPALYGRPELDLPAVTVQLPIYNERDVVGRLVDAACRLSYPRALLQIQVLDDSTDDTSDIVAERVARWRACGIDIEHVRRRVRSGYKAGALAHGLESATGEFILVLDADFVPGPGLVRDLLGPFGDSRVGMVQARWGHLNESQNWLTAGQALLLDGHFFFEHGGRYGAGRFFNFNGTAGMWRTTCLRASGDGSPIPSRRIST